MTKVTPSSRGAATKREIYWPGSLEIEFPVAVET
jgi:hypothetical protein